MEKFDDGDASLHQLRDWKEQYKNFSLIARDQDGLRVTSLTSSLTAGPGGPILLSDSNLLKHIENMNRKNIPQRVFGKRGTGAFGHFEVTKDITKICSADLFKVVGQKTDIFIRFSSAGNTHFGPTGERGVYSGSIKHYTKDGNWDLLGTQVSVFPLRDPSLFASMMQSRVNPISGTPSETGKWDFYTNRPETVHHVLRLHSILGIPASFTTMNMYPISVFKMYNSSGTRIFVRFLVRADAGIKGLTDAEALEKRSEDRDFLINNFFNAIANGENPSWTLYIQSMDIDTMKGFMEQYNFDPFDPTKIWPSKEFPFQEVGKYVLTQNVTNQFNEVEQAAFNPGNLVPGIEPALGDRLLQGRLFAYRDAQLYRVGANVSQLPVNHPKGLVYKLRTYAREGPMNYDERQGGAPNYYPNSFSGPEIQPGILQNPPENYEGEIGRWDLGEEDNFSQATAFYDRFGPQEKKEIAGSIARDINNTSEVMQERVVKMFEKVSLQLAFEITQALLTMAN